MKYFGEKYLKANTITQTHIFCEKKVFVERGMTQNITLQSNVINGTVVFSYHAVVVAFLLLFINLNYLEFINYFV